MRLYELPDDDKSNTADKTLPTVAVPRNASVSETDKNSGIPATTGLTTPSSSDGVFSPPYSLPLNNPSAVWNFINRPQEYAVVHAKTYEQISGQALGNKDSYSHSEALRRLASNPAGSPNPLFSAHLALSLAGGDTKASGSIPEVQNVPSPGLKCDTCSRVFHYEVLFDIHKRQHSGEFLLAEKIS